MQTIEMFDFMSNSSCMLVDGRILAVTNSVLIYDNYDLRVIDLNSLEVICLDKDLDFDFLCLQLRDKSVISVNNKTIVKWY
jgi:hypothetical protein